MAINFPSVPIDGQTHTEAGVTWKYNTAKGAWLTATSGSLAAHTHVTGDITGVATSSLLGRVTAAVGVAEVLTPAQARTLLNVADGANNYIHPNHSGDVTSVADGAQTIAGNAVTNAKLADMATATFKGRTTAATGDPEDLTATQATALLNLFSSTLKGLVPLSGGGTANFLRADGAFAAPPGGSTIPPGAMMEYGAIAAPTDWLLCDGAAVSRTTYAALFAAISTNYGFGDGSTTFNVPDRRGRVGVGYGTGTISEAIAAANWNISDLITCASNPQGTKPKWQTGMKVQVTTTGVLPTGVVAATDYYVRRKSATTIELYATYANAIETQKTTGRVNITATGSGTHTMTHTLQNRALNDQFGMEVSSDTPSHYHDGVVSSTDTNSVTAATPTVGTLNGDSNPTGDLEGITNFPPSIVVNYIIKT